MNKNDINYLPLLFQTQFNGLSLFFFLFPRMIKGGSMYLNES